ncbi:MAG: hypothetical protein AAB850_00445 [Patescibacteria group bacterium]
MDAMSTGVEALGINAVVAASAFVEKGQKALARSGKKAAAPMTAANPSMKNCWLNVMGKQG